MEKRSEKQKRTLVLLLVAAFVVFSSIIFISAAPVNPDGISYGTNSTSSGSSSQMIVNISGGYISNFNLTATIQNSRWKAFVGQVIGTFTLDDSTGSTIYDWQLDSLTGRVYTTRKTSTPVWSSIACANSTHLETENGALSFVNRSSDNITATFDEATHGLFFVGTKPFNANDCSHTVNTNVNNNSQSVVFEEVALYDGTDIIYAGILEQGSAGYNGQDYDFQMIVPENASIGFTGATPYYMYVELD